MQQKNRFLKYWNPEKILKRQTPAIQQMSSLKLFNISQHLSKQIILSGTNQWEIPYLICKFLTTVHKNLNIKNSSYIKYSVCCGDNEWKFVVVMKLVLKFMKNKADLDDRNPSFDQSLPGFLFDRVHLE